MTEYLRSCPEEFADQRLGDGDAEGVADEGQDPAEDKLPDGDGRGVGAPVEAAPRGVGDLAARDVFYQDVPRSPIVEHLRKGLLEGSLHQQGRVGPGLRWQRHPGNRKYEDPGQDGASQADVNQQLPLVDPKVTRGTL